MTAEKKTLQTAHQKEVDELKASQSSNAETLDRESLRAKLLVFSQFLRSAAAKRLVETEMDSEESKAFEGALLLVYGGDQRAVDAAVDLIEGADKPVPNVEGQILNVTCKSLM